MGLLDLPFPLLNLVDGALASFLPPVARIVLWGLLGGAVAMLLYRLVSNQERIRGKFEAMREIRGQLAKAEEFDEVKRLSMLNLRTSLSALGNVIGPALVSALPVLVMIAWMAAHYGFERPAAGMAINLTTSPVGAELTSEPAAALEINGVARTIAWPAADGTTMLADASGTELIALPIEPPLDIVGPHRWWNWLIGNPAGYLPDGAAIQTLRFEFEPARYLGFGPGWMRGWEVVFFVSMLINSIVLKIVLRIA